MISVEAITTSIYRIAQAEFPEGVSIAWPGAQLESDGLDEWIEIWCDDVSGMAQRIGPIERRDVSLTVHVFVRPSAETTRVQEIAEAVSRVFHTRTISVLSPAIDPETVVGTLRMREAEVRDLTRLHAQEQHRPLRHIVVLVQGIAQSLATAA